MSVIPYVHVPYMYIAFVFRESCSPLSCPALCDVTLAAQAFGREHGLFPAANKKPGQSSSAKRPASASAPTSSGPPAKKKSYKGSVPADAWKPPGWPAEVPFLQKDARMEMAKKNTCWLCKETGHAWHTCEKLQTGEF